MLASSRSPSFSLHFLPIMPSILRSPSMSPSPSSSPSPHSTRSSSPAYTPSQTIHHRRTILRAKSDDERTPPPPALHGFADFFHARTTVAPFSVPAATQRESDAECWVRMLALQREYHCYKSARLEAAVEALESGYSIEDVPMREYFLFSICTRLTSS